MELAQEGLVNRYDDPLLQDYYSEITACLTEYEDLRRIVVDTLKVVCKPGETILDIGAGRGDSAEPILKEISDVSIDLLDVSSEMLGMADKFLNEYAGRYKIILEDALVYLKQCAPYTTMISEFTVHNFSQGEKKILFEAICRKIESGGTFVLLDKVQQDEPEIVRELFEAQMERYRQGLEPKVAKAMIAHEVADYESDVRMQESSTLEMLKEVGFGKVEVVQRIKRDVVIRATK